MTAIYRLRLLGSVEVERDGVSVRRDFVSLKARAILGYLAAGGQPVSRSRLADLFWQDKAERQGRANLSVVKTNLSHLLPGCLQADNHTIQFQPTTATWLDTQAFTELTTQADITALAAAVELYRGDFMTDIHLDDCPEFSAWLEAEQMRWRQQVGQALQKLINHHIYRGEYEQGLRYTSRWLALDSCQEEAHQHRMLLLARIGQRSAALAQYETCCRILTEEVGVEPAAETTALYQRIRAAESSPRHNLLAQPHPFVGREAEVAKIMALMADPACRLLTLVGPGGIGKTRLAIQAAQQIALDKVILFLNGVYFVPLDAVSSVDLLAVKIADSLKLSLYGAIDPKIQLLTYLKDKEVLLVLDNFEHLVAGVDLLVEILQQASTVKLLIH